MGLTKEQWMDAIGDIQEKVYDGICLTSYATETPAEGLFPDILFAEMENCIGLDDKKPYMRAGKYFYKPYRNYYDAGPEDEPMWEALVEKHLAWRVTMYHLTIEGFYLLGLQMGIYIYNSSEGDRLLREVKDYFIYRSMDCSHGCWYPITKGEVMRGCLLTREKVNWAIQKLLEEGWIEHYEYAGRTGDGFPVYRRGFTASKKLEETDEYKRAWKEECEALDAIIRGEN